MGKCNNSSGYEKDNSSELLDFELKFFTGSPAKRQQQLNHAAPESARWKNTLGEGQKITN